MLIIDLVAAPWGRGHRQRWDGPVLAL